MRSIIQLGMVGHQGTKALPPNPNRVIVPEDNRKRASAAGGAENQNCLFTRMSHFYTFLNGHFCQKCPFSDQKKWHFEWPNKNSKTTFIVRTFPKNGPYGFDLVNLSLLGAILAIFQFCGFSGLFWPFFPCKKCKNENLSLNFNFWSITLKFFL